MSPPRKRGSSACRGHRQWKDWIPAFAGMTRRGVARRAKLAPMGSTPATTETAAAHVFARGTDLAAELLAASLGSVGIRHTPSRRPHESMNFRSLEPVNGAPKPVERRASHDALWRAASGGRRPLTGSKLRKQEAFIRSAALPVKRRRTPTRRACSCRRRADQSDGRMSRVAAGPSSGASRHSRAFADRR